MQENEFERQVKKQMDDIKITPSAAVWEAVDREIRVRRKRRAVILFWFFSFIAVGAAFLIFRHSGDTNLANENTVVTKQQNAQKVDKIAASVSLKAIAGQETLTVVNRRDNQSKSAGVNKLPDDLIASSNIIEQDVSGKKPREPAEAHQLNGKLLQFESARSAIDEISFSDPVLPEGKSAGDLLRANELTAPIKDVAHNQQSKGIEWSFTAGAGFSSFAGHAERVNQVYATVPSASLASFINANQFLTPQPERAGHSYYAGLSGKKYIGRKSFVTAGLGYQFLSTRISAGQQVNNPLSNSYVGGVYRFSNFFAVGANTPYNFSNQFHLISIPLGYGMNLFNKLPISFNVGLSPQLLITSTALHYDKTNGVYYPNSSLINKFQLQAFTQLDYHLKLKGKRSVYAGPDVEYGITDMVNRSVNGSNHLLRYGLHAGFSFSRKK